MRFFFTALTFLIFVYPATAQKISLDDLKNWNPRSIGPAGMSGRVTAIDVVVNNPNIWYVGAASGGVWKTENSGASWTSLFDDQENINIGSIAIQQSNPNIVWVGTGEGNPRNSINIGEGIYKSIDGGKTWRRMGLEKTRNIHRVIIDPGNPDIVYAGVIGNPYADHPERGVYKTTDGGATWNRILYTNERSGTGDLVMDPSNPNKLIAAMWEHRRTPWDFKSGGPGSGLYVTYDGGRNWKKLGTANGLPAGELGRIGVAFARSMPTRVYAKVEAAKNGLYESNDGGTNWVLINSKPEEVTDRPFYYQEIYVDPKNENRIYDIHSTVTYSEDGGRNFKTLLPYSGIHPDHHAWWIHPENPDFILDGNDGGMGISRDRGRTWNFDEKLPFGQFYHINVDNAFPYNVMGGMQDNGSWHGPAYTFTNSGIRNYFWNNVGGGDGFDVVPDPGEEDWVYSMSQGGNVQRLNVKTGERWFIKPPATTLSEKLRFNWNSGIAVDPFDNNTVYYGSQYLHKSNNKGASWQTISLDLTTNNPEQQKQDETGGLTLDITGAETYNTILAIAPSTKDRDVIWVSTDDGNVQLTRDGGKTWTNFRGKIPGLPLGIWIPQIHASRYNAAEAVVVANDYRRGDFNPYIFRTTDYGRTWARVVDDKKVRGYALSFVQDPVEPNLLFVGTEHGLFISFDNGGTFQQWKNGYPQVSTFDMTIQEREADLVIGTFGRSIWVLDDIRPLRQMAANTGRAFTKSITLFAAPDAYQVTYKPAQGYDWSTYGLWDAPNKRRGAMISFYVKPVSNQSTTNNITTTTAQKAAQQKRSNVAYKAPVGPDTTVRKIDSVQVRIYNDKNELIRNLRWKADTGFNRQWWGMEEKGFRYPGSPKPRPGAPEPAGLQVFPGTYKVVLELGRDADSTMVIIKDDPRLEKTLDVRVAQRATLEKLRNLTDRLTIATDQLAESEETLNKLQTQLAGLEGKEMDSLRKATTIMRDSIKHIREFISGKPAERQGISRPAQVTVMNSIQTAQQYIMSKSVAPGTQEEALISNAGEMINQTIRRVNRFYDINWKEYRRQVEGTRISLFKDYQPIR
jgi:photosystem II stability/assembly factor-like uncharacterized protein